MHFAAVRRRWGGKRLKRQLPPLRRAKIDEMNLLTSGLADSPCNTILELGIGRWREFLERSLVEDTIISQRVF